MRTFLICLFSTTLFSLHPIQAQDLMSFLDSTETPTKTYTENTFKSVRLINGYTMESAGFGDLVFSISHRFDAFNTGINELYGIDHSTIRFGFEYGITQRFSLGIGRTNSYDKLVDGFFKYRLIRQLQSGGTSPLSVTVLSSMSVKTFIDSPRDNYPFSGRLCYSHELLIARKFNRSFSMQLVPMLVHRNMVLSKAEKNLLFALGSGANYTVNHWLSISAEYAHLLTKTKGKDSDNSLSFGVEMESGGGHTFQVLITNSIGMTEKHFIGDVNGKWSKGDIGIGFNIIRIFHIKKKAHNK